MAASVLQGLSNSKEELELLAARFPGMGVAVASANAFHDSLGLAPQERYAQLALAGPTDLQNIRYGRNAGVSIKLTLSVQFIRTYTFLWVLLPFLASQGFRGTLNLTESQNSFWMAHILICQMMGWPEEAIRVSVAHLCSLFRPV